MKYFYSVLLCFLTFFMCKAQIVNIPDPFFKAKLLQASPSTNVASHQSPSGTGTMVTNNTIDTNGDGEIQVSEALLVKCLGLFSSNISDLTGLEAFVNLESFWCTFNQLTQVDVSMFPNLKYFDCSYNQLTTCNITGLSNLLRFWCTNNLLTEIDFTGCTALFIVSCSNNQLSSLVVPSISSLHAIGCNNNFPLTSLSIKDGLANFFVEFENTPNLQYICADPGELDLIQQKINNYGYTNCHVNSYCTFPPGGNFYTVQGTTRLDLDGNGCSIEDSVFPFFKLNVASPVNYNTVYANHEGTYAFFSSSTACQLTPILENPDYFSVTPSTVEVNFGSETSPFTQNFCVSPIGTRNDLDVVIIPIDAARPGFDAFYKIVYRNKGNQMAEGTLSLGFNDTILDLVSSNPDYFNGSSDTLTWNFNNLAPFESRAIYLSFNINSPMETPAVNGGDFLNFSSVVTGFSDETPEDNTFTLNQIVVNSYDPNDKTCLEGNTISPDMVGEYIHYVIRFENTGTYAAQNVVIMDPINPDNFDINTLVPLDSSHSFRTNIKGNIVEFIFENINLPFEDENNDGFIAFKIKTKPYLAVGITFSNFAKIYFDYNFPIVTDPATTTISLLNSEEFDVGSDLKLYPNPVIDFLQIEANNQSVISNIEIYNAVGQLVLALVGPSGFNNVDVSSLAAGTYIVQASTKEGKVRSRFIKR